MKIAIVGPEESKWKSKEQIAKAKREIKYALAGYMPSMTCYTSPDKLEKEKERFEQEKEKLIVVSGHCPKGGVDIWVEEIADELGIAKEIYPAEVNQWEDSYDEHGRESDWRGQPCHRLKGYKSRNIQIAELCEVLYCIVPKTEDHPYSCSKTFKKYHCIHCNQRNHLTNGGCWTMKYAKEIGKEAHLVVIY